MKLKIFFQSFIALKVKVNYKYNYDLFFIVEINELVKMFTEDQLEIVDYLRKNLHATNLFFDLVGKSNMFGKLSSRLQLLKSLEAIPENTKSVLNDSNLKSQRRMTNPQQYEELDVLENKKSNVEVESKDNCDEEGDLLAQNEYDEYKIQSHFDYMFTRKNHSIIN
jgi:hypothetical protein